MENLSVLAVSAKQARGYCHSQLWADAVFMSEQIYIVFVCPSSHTALAKMTSFIHKHHHSTHNYSLYTHCSNSLSQREKGTQRRGSSDIRSNLWHLQTVSIGQKANSQIVQIAK